MAMNLRECLWEALRPFANAVNKKNGQVDHVFEKEFYRRASIAFDRLYYEWPQDDDPRVLALEAEVRDLRRTERNLREEIQQLRSMHYG